MHVVVVGCGRVGSGLARTLEESGHSVAVVDRRSKAFERLPEAAERRLFEARIAPYTRALGGLPPGAALPGDHLFLADGVLVGSWPADDWDAHIARCGLSGEVAAETGAPDHAEWISALRATLARR